MPVPTRITAPFTDSMATAIIATMSPCLSPSDFEQLAARTLDPDRLAAINAHLSQCHNCRAEAEEYRRNEAFLAGSDIRAAHDQQQTAELLVTLESRASDHRPEIEGYQFVRDPPPRRPQKCTGRRPRRFLSTGISDTERHQDVS